jgi:hypothetical protein
MACICWNICRSSSLPGTEPTPEGLVQVPSPLSRQTPLRLRVTMLSVLHCNYVRLPRAPPSEELKEQIVQGQAAIKHTRKPLTHALVLEHLQEFLDALIASL